MADIDHLPLRRDLIATALRMNHTGINQGTSGNLSVRIPGGFLITPTSIPYDELEPDDIVAMDFDGGHAGRRRPSSEWRFHRDILKARSDIDVVLHNHSTFATALSCHRLDIPAFHYMVAVAGGKAIRCADYATFGTEELSRNALAALVSCPRSKVPFRPLIFPNDRVSPFGPDERFGGGVAVVEVAADG
jgi:L-fuculose-phosphate aldolase